MLKVHSFVCLFSMATLGLGNVASAQSYSVLWSADVETGNKSQWYAPSTGPTGSYGGGEYNSGTGSSNASQAYAHGGKYSLEMSISTPPESGTRMFRWKEPRDNAKNYYSAWFYIPQRTTVKNYWNVFQFKSSRSGANDPFFILNVGNRSDGTMNFYLYNWQKRQSYTQTVKNIPVGKWFKVEAMYQCAGNGTGRVTFWQDGTQLFDVANVQTRYSDGDCQWSLNNYSDGLSPAASKIYIDDVMITNGFTGGGGGTTPPAPSTLTITNTTLPGATSGSSYATALAASGGTTPYTWSVTGGQLPPGLTLSSQGALSGKPTTAGTFSFTAQVRDSATSPQTASATYSLRVAEAPPSPLSITTTSLPGATVMAFYSANLTASGGLQPHVWSVQSGQLPPGLTLSTQGAITGTPSSTGSFSLGVQARDSAGTPQTATANLTIQVANPVTSSSAIWSGDVETGDKSQWGSGSGGGEFNSGTGYTNVSQAHAHSGKYSLELNITTPPESGTRMFRWKESQTHAKLFYSAWLYFPQRHSVTVNWNVLQFKSKRSNGANDPFYVLDVGNNADGSMRFHLYDWQRKVKYTQTAKTIPVGQWFKVEAMYKCAPDGTGEITIWQDGVQLHTLSNVQTRYSDGDCQWSINNYSGGLSPASSKIYLDDAMISTERDTGGGTPPPPTPGPSPLVITSTSLSGGTSGTAYSAALTASGGTQPYTWSVIAGQLPPGLTLSNQGAISGTPSSSGSFNFSAQVRDSAGTPQTATFLYTINVAAPQPTNENVLWFGDVETGDKSQWSPGGTGGGEFNSGTGYTNVSQAYAHGGRYSLEMNITTPPTSGTRMFRWKESQAHQKLYYTAWLYFPQRHTVNGFWNVVQFKSKRTNGANDPFFVLDVGNRGDGTMFFHLFNWQTRVDFPQSLKNIPVGQWFKIEAMYKCAPDGTGQITVWQDGTQLYDLPNIQTRYSDGDCQWSVNNYGDGLSPASSKIYLDDAKIVLK